MGIYRGEVTTIMWALADIYVNTERLLGLFEDEDGEEEDQEDG